MNETNPTPQIPEQEPREEHFYQTGSTQPPKSHQGLIALLLVAVIFLGGIASALGLLNIHLFRQLRSEETAKAASFRFSNRDSTEQTPIPQSRAAVCLGICVENISAFYRNYYRLPQGLYISQVDPDSDAAAKGVVPGDILVAFDGVRVTGTDSLESLLCSRSAGQTVSVLLYRNGQQYKLELTIGGT